ncbi:MAG: hypothetical protein ACLQVL_11940 [Terriglobia bacterium]
MSLEESRNVVNRLLVSRAPEADLVEPAAAWFMEMKNWEVNETFERAFREFRMTARVCATKDFRNLDVKDSVGKPSQMVHDAGVEGMAPRLVPQNFIDKRKNLLGLHDLSAVLLRPKVPLKFQIFIKGAGEDQTVVFMPIPLEADMKVFHKLSQLAKATKPPGPLYPWLLDSRARLTRLNYGSADDMMIGFMNVTEGKAPGRQHLRYGAALKIGTPIKPELLELRKSDALNYVTAIARKPPSNEGNNEVTVKYREHAGQFPYFGALDVKSERYSVGKTGPLGWVDQDGNFQAVTEQDKAALAPPQQPQKAALAPPRQPRGSPPPERKLRPTPTLSVVRK